MPVVKRLPHRLGIVIPSRDRRGRPLAAALRREIDKAVSGWFTTNFGGETAERIGRRDRLLGRFQVAPGQVVVEAVKELWAQCTAREFVMNRPRLVRLAEWVCQRGDQVVVAIFLDVEMQLVEAPKRAVPRPT